MEEQNNSLDSKPAKPDNYLVWSILTTLLCCLPLGIVAIVYSSKVDGLYMAEYYQEAQDAADKAKKFTLIGAIVGLVVLVLYVIIIIGGALAI